MLWKKTVLPLHDVKKHLIRIPHSYQNLLKRRVSPSLGRWEDFAFLEEDNSLKYALIGEKSGSAFCWQRPECMQAWLPHWEVCWSASFPPKKDTLLMGWPHKWQPDGNTMKSQEINPIIKHSGHIGQNELPGKGLHATLGSVMNKGRRQYRSTSFPLSHSSPHVHNCNPNNNIYVLPLISHICSADTSILADL